MRILLDTHSFLWFITGDTRISTEARDLITDLDNQALLSVASLWEIAIKASLGKLTQAMTRSIPLVSGDTVLDQYPIRRLW